jgi:hypothetical protein
LKWNQFEHILPLYALAKRLRYEKEIKTVHLFPLLPLEMLHGRVEVVKQEEEALLLWLPASRQGNTLLQKPAPGLSFQAKTND